MAGNTILLASACSFVGSHFALSHPLRAPLIKAAGERGFMLVYSLAAFATLGLTVWAYQQLPITQQLWRVGGVLWAISTVAMLLASVLLLGSVVRNPALPGAASTAATAKASGVFGITRHPMMWAFAIWGVSHILIYPIGKNIILTGAIIVLALVGAALQDRKKASLDPAGWTAWERRTSYWPFVAIAQGRAKLSGLGGHALGGGTVVWLVATWAHIPIAGWRAGIWRWIT